MSCKFKYLLPAALASCYAVVSQAHAQESTTAGAADRQNAASTDNASNDASGGLQTVVVTGSFIPTTPDAVAIPVVTLDAEKIAQAGVSSNALEILRKSIPAFAGRSNAGASNANNDNQRTGGGSQLQLRNLPTLVLVNGRRMAIDAIAGTNGKNFVDVNQIPPSAIDHIEVLTDGASSIYGSDAVGGVVNFILKSDYEGLQAGGRYGGAEGGYRERSGFLTGGTHFGNTRITASASYTHTDPLFQNARSFASPMFSRLANVPGSVAANGGSPGAILAPGLTSPSAVNPTGTAATATSVGQLIANGTYNATTPGALSGAFDASQYQTILSEQEQSSFVMNLDSRLFDDRVTVYGDALFSHGTNSLQWLPVFSTPTVPAGAPYNPLTTAFTGVTFNELSNPKQFGNTTDSGRVLAGLKGKIAGDWTWDTSLDFSQSNFRQLIHNVIFKPNLTRAIAGGFDQAGNAVPGGAYSQVLGGLSVSGPLVLQPALDPFALAAGQSAASLANLYGTETIGARSRLYAWDGKVVGSVFSLPAGEVSVAAGLAFRREELTGQADANGRVTDPVTGKTVGNAQLWQGGLNFDPFKAHRSIGSLFAETRIPITSPEWHVPGLFALDLTAAMRAEKYSDTGRSNVPKIGFRWQPFDRQLTVRGNYSKSYSAPFLYSEYAPISTRQVAATVIQGLFGPNYGGLPFNGQDGNNPNLKPATSVSRSLGLVFRPDFIQGLTVSADFSSINLYGFPGGIGVSNILDSVNKLGAASPFFNNLGVDGFVGSAGASQPFANPGQLLAFITNPNTGKGDPGAANRLFIADQFQNLGVLQERSYTVAADYILPWTTYGTFTVSTNGAIFKSFHFQDAPGHAFIQYAGSTNNAGATGGFGGTLPTYRFFTSLDWTRNNWDVSVNNTYVSGTNDTGVNGTSVPTIPVASYVTFDTRVAYDWRQEGHHPGDVLFALGVNNIADRMPPLAPRAFVDNNADVSTFSPIGRLIYATATVTF
ncbi:MAG: TonB-dependent receptor [Gammaproteobacteria bacterium]|nr:TonB-dependent receptor [Gammaproteobacteria bacterium]